MGTDHHLNRRTFLSAAAVAGLGGTLLAACGGDDDGSGGGGGGGSKKVTVEWWNIATTEPGKTLFPQLAKAYMAAHPNVTIKATSLENEAFKTKLTAAIASGKLPHIYHSWGGGVLKQQIDAGLVTDLTDKIASWSGQLVPAALLPYQFDGRTYGVPFDSGMIGFWYNKALFEKAKISAPPKTWAEYLDAVRKLKAAGVTPIALAGKEKWPGHYYWTYLALRIGGPNIFKEALTSNDFSGPAFVEAGAEVKKLVDLQPFQPGFLSAGYPSPGGQAATMGNGKAAMELMGQWAPSVESDAGKGIGDDLGWFPFPTVDGKPGTASEVVGGGNGLAFSKDAPDEAFDFAKFFIVNSQDKLVSVGANMPVVKGGEQYLKDENLKTVAAAVNSSTGFQLYLDQAFPPAVGQQINDSTAALIAGKKSPEDVAKDITKVAKSQ